MKLSRKKVSIFCAAIAAALCSFKTFADESLDVCSSEKIRQMELVRRIKLAPPPQVDPYTGRTYNSFNKEEAKDDVDRTEVWLWKNCRSYSEEMHKIEQQYM